MHALILFTVHITFNIYIRYKKLLTSFIYKRNILDS